MDNYILANQLLNYLLLDKYLFYKDLPDKFLLDSRLSASPTRASLAVDCYLREGWQPQGEETEWRPDIGARLAQHYLRCGMVCFVSCGMVLSKSGGSCRVEGPCRV